MGKKIGLPDYYTYTAVFEIDSGGFWLAAFPDLEGCATNARTLEGAIIQAQNILEDYMAIIERDDRLTAPPPTPFDAVRVPAGGIAQRIVASMEGARRRWENESVKRTVTLPAWLDEKGQEANLNFSQLLQAAVTRELRI